MSKNYFNAFLFKKHLFWTRLLTISHILLTLSHITVELIRFFNSKPKTVVVEHFINKEENPLLNTYFNTSLNQEI